MRVKTEGVHDGEFLLSEANGERSRRNIVVAEGENLVAGQVVRSDTDKIKAYTDEAQTAVGILYGAVDATDADKPGVIIDNDAECKQRLINWGESEAADIAAGLVDLAALGIRITDRAQY